MTLPVEKGQTRRYVPLPLECRDMAMHLGLFEQGEETGDAHCASIGVSPRDCAYNVQSMKANETTSIKGK